MWYVTSVRYLYNTEKEITIVISFFINNTYNLLVVI